MSSESHNLPTLVIKSLGDKTYDKRKNAALEIERTVTQLLEKKEEAKVIATIAFIRAQYVSNDQPNMRKGGVIGLAACAMAIAHTTGSISAYMNEFLPPMLTCFTDPDAQVRFYACEALYNVAKVARHEVLLYFSRIFDELSKLCADPDQNVRSVSETLDRLMKDIVTEQPEFDLNEFIPLLAERIYAANPFVRQFLVSWIGVLDSVPDVDMLSHLPSYLSGLFKILGDSQQEITRACSAVLAEFLNEIKQQNNVDNHSILQILSAYCSSEDYLSKITAITWVNEFVILAEDAVILPFLPTLLRSILPCLSKDTTQKEKDIQELAMIANTRFRNLVTEAEDLGTFNFEEAHAVLSRLLVHVGEPSMCAALKWMKLLRQVLPVQMYAHAEEIHGPLLKILSDKSPEVLRQGIKLIAAMSTTKEDEEEFAELSSTFFDHFMEQLVKLFSTDSSLLSRADSSIVRLFCKFLSPQRIYSAFADIVVRQAEPIFASTLVQNLNIILLTATELSSLRNDIMSLETPEACALFQSLYRCWSHNPVATFSLCLLAQVYDHAADLLLEFGKLDIDIMFLVEVDRLIQLLESPIFTYLRLQLLEPKASAYLIKCLYGLLMLLPQSSAYNTLKNRLDCIPVISSTLLHLESDSPKPSGNIGKDLGFADLLEHFAAVQGSKAKPSATTSSSSSS